MNIEWERFQKTEKLFHKNPYLKEQQAKVLYVKDNDVVLDQSIFYAEAGGQVADKGSINGYEVVDVQKYGKEYTKFFDAYKEDYTYVVNNAFIVHSLKEKPDFLKGDTVDLKLNWQHRYNVMKNHTVAHFLYISLQKFIGEDEKIGVLGCYIDDQKSRFDITQKILRDDLPTIEDYANKLIEKNKDIIMRPFNDNDDAFLWVYDNHEVPCGGTHIKNAKEIGRITLNRRSKGRRTTRISAILV